MPIKWKREYNLGIKSIDNQHRHLVDLINKLEESKDQENESKVVHDIFYELVDYTKYHFKEEEVLLHSFQFDEVYEHEAQHKVLIKQIVEMLNLLKNGELEIGEKLTSVLKNWLIKHVLHHDKIFAKHYLAHI